MKRILRKLDQDSRLTIAGLFLLLVTWAIDFFRAPAFERASFLILPLLMFVFFLIHTADRLRLESRLEEGARAAAEQQLARLSEFTWTVQGLLERRLPSTEFIRGKEEVETELTKAASEAKRFIMATGGKSRIKKYLDTITSKVAAGSVAYTRIIFGGQIYHELCVHLCSVVGQSKVRIAHAPDEKSGTALITDNTLIFTTIPSTSADVFDTIVKVPDPIAAEDYRDYLTDLLLRSKTLESPLEIKSLCLSCGTTVEGQKEERALGRPPHRGNV